MKYPNAWSSDKINTQPPVQAGAKVEARIDMSAEVAGVGKCPECKRPMRIITSSGARMWVCEADRITLPLPNGYEEKS